MEWALEYLNFVCVESRNDESVWIASIFSCNKDSLEFKERTPRFVYFVCILKRFAGIFTSFTLNSF